MLVSHGMMAAMLVQPVQENIEHGDLTERGAVKAASARMAVHGFRFNVDLSIC